MTRKTHKKHLPRPHAALEKGQAASGKAALGKDGIGGANGHAGAARKDATKASFNLGAAIRILLIAGFIVVSFYLLWATPWGRDVAHGRFDEMRAWLDNWGAGTWIVFVLAGTALVSIGFPRIAFAALGGAMFGFLEGAVLAQIASTLSIAPGYYYTRWLGRELVEVRLGSRLQRLDFLLRQHGFMVTLLIRLSPVGNAFLTNCIGGITSISFPVFLAASFLGYVPETLIFALMGSGLHDHFQLRLWTGIILFALFSLYFLWYFNRSPLGAEIMRLLRNTEKKS